VTVNAATRPLAAVTGASSGIGLELARQCARHGYDLMLAADQPLHDAARQLRMEGVRVDALQLDLSILDDIEVLCAALHDRRVDVLIANTGHGHGQAFLDQDFSATKHVIDTHITGTLFVVRHRIQLDAVMPGCALPARAPIDAWRPV
jgi:short-subunit dehydrogenase